MKRSRAEVLSNPAGSKRKALSGRMGARWRRGEGIYIYIYIYVCVCVCVGWDQNGKAMSVCVYAGRISRVPYNALVLQIYTHGPVTCGPTYNIYVCACARTSRNHLAIRREQKDGRTCVCARDGENKKRHEVMGEIKGRCKRNIMRRRYYYICAHVYRVCGRYAVVRYSYTHSRFFSRSHVYVCVCIYIYICIYVQGMFCFSASMCSLCALVMLI